MDNYSMIGGLDFGSSFVLNSLPNVGLASGNGFSYGSGLDAGWGQPGPYMPSTTITGPYSPQAPVYTPDPYINHNDQPAYLSPYAPQGPAVYLSPGGMISDTVTPYQPPSFGGFVDWMFGGGN